MGAFALSRRHYASSMPYFHCGYSLMIRGFFGEMLTKNSLSTDLTCRYPGDVTALEKMSPGEEFVGAALQNRSD
jgi:hypothetical protein